MTVTTFALLLLKGFLAVLAADLYSGTLHWFLDTYGNPNWKFLNIGEVLVKPSHAHHYEPRGLLKPTFWQRNKLRYVFATVLSIIGFLMGVSLPILAVFFVFAAHTSEFHAITHRTSKENGKIISFLQKIRIIQTNRHHWTHHNCPYDTYFCVITNVLNPILDWLNFWKILEFMLSLVGIKPLQASLEKQHI